MENIKQAWRQQFGCTKSFLKVHNFAYVLKQDSSYAVEEVCLNCHQPRG